MMDGLLDEREIYPNFLCSDELCQDRTVHAYSIRCSKCEVIKLCCCFCLFLWYFYPRDAMLARVIVIATCPSVRPSVRLSVRHAPVLCQNEES